MYRQKSTLHVLPELTRRLVLHRYGSFEHLHKAWSQESDSQQDFPDCKSAATLRRWLRQGLPVKRPSDGVFSLKKLDLSIFALSSLLNVDPLAIFDFERNGYFADFSAFRRVIYQNRYRMGGLAPMVAMFRPTSTWPSNEIAQCCYGRPWFAKEFSSQESWQPHKYLHVNAVFATTDDDQPLAAHVAYRLQNGRDPSWRYYGTVILIDGNLKLYSEGGEHMTGKAPQTDAIGFRTFYGGGDVSWRVVSLHEFSLTITTDYSDEQTIGFLW